MGATAAIYTRIKADASGMDAGLNAARAKLRQFRGDETKAVNPFGNFGVGGEGLMLGGQIIKLGIAANTVAAGFKLAQAAMAGFAGEGQKVGDVLRSLPMVGVAFGAMQDFVKDSMDRRNMFLGNETDDEREKRIESEKKMAEARKQHADTMRELIREMERHNALIGKGEFDKQAQAARNEFEATMERLRKMQADPQTANLSLFLQAEAQAKTKLLGDLADVQTARNKAFAEESEARRKVEFQQNYGDMIEKRRRIAAEDVAMKAEALSLIEGAKTEEEKRLELQARLNTLVDREKLSREQADKILSRQFPARSGMEIDTALMRVGGEQAGATMAADETNRILEEVLGVLRNNLTFGMRL